MNSAPFSFLVQDIRQETPNAKLYIFDYGLTPFEFYPGQFTVLTLPNSAPDLTAPITLACSPLRRDTFEFIVVRTGNFGTRFYDRIQVGDLIPMRPPMGKFHLEISDPRPIIYLAYDYCISGARSFWQYHEDVQMPKPLYVVHPQRGQNNALFRNEFESTAAQNRRYLPIALPDEEGAQLDIATLSSILNTVQGALIYIAGEARDVRALQENVLNSGVTPSNIKIERWS